MIDKEYIKEIISCITKKKADGNIVPATASMSEIMTAVREDAMECMRTMCNEREIAVNRTLNSVSFKCLYLMGEERNFEFFIGDCQLPAVVSPESTIWLLPADSNEEEVSGSIKKHVDKAAESGDRMSSCRYGNISGEFTLDVECSEGSDELLLEILYGDRIRKTIERLNYEWLKKMWKASDDDFRVFWFEQIRKKFEEHEDQN